MATFNGSSPAVQRIVRYQYKLLVDNYGFRPPKTNSQLASLLKSLAIAMLEDRLETELPTPIIDNTTLSDLPAIPGDNEAI